LPAQGAYLVRLPCGRPAIGRTTHSEKALTVGLGAINL